MKEQSKHIDISSVELKIINSNAFYATKMLGLGVAMIGILLGALVFTRGSNPNALSQFIELPFVVQLLLGILAFVLFFLGISFQINKYQNNGKLLLKDNEIRIDNEIFPPQNCSIIVHFNSLKDKNNYKRDFMEGCNNWFEIERNGSIITKEFRLESKEQEEMVRNRLIAWERMGIDVTTKQRKKSFWQMWNEF